MGRDNQDYFKRGGRSGGPPGPLRHFREQIGQQRARLARGAARFPGAQTRETAGPRSEAPNSAASASNSPREHEPHEPNGASAASPAEHAGRQADEAPFGPPASEEFAEKRRDGVQEMPHDRGGAEALPAPFDRLVRRYPRLSRAFARMSRLPEKPARWLAEAGRRIEKSVESGGR